MHEWVNECRYKAVELGMIMLYVFMYVCETVRQYVCMNLKVCV